jgi:hypothetical protein
MASLLRAYKYVFVNPTSLHSSQVIGSTALLRRPYLASCTTAAVHFGAGDVIGESLRTVAQWTVSSLRSHLEHPLHFLISLETEELINMYADCGSDLQLDVIDCVTFWIRKECRCR